MVFSFPAINLSGKWGQAPFLVKKVAGPHFPISYAIAALSSIVRNDIWGRGVSLYAPTFS